MMVFGFEKIEFISLITWDIELVAQQGRMQRIGGIEHHIIIDIKTKPQLGDVYTIALLRKIKVN